MAPFLMLKFNFLNKNRCLTCFFYAILHISNEVTLKKGVFMNLFRLTALCAILTISSAQAMPGLSQFGSAYNDEVYVPQLAPGRSSSKSERLEAIHDKNASHAIQLNNLNIVDYKNNTNASQAPNSLIIALKNDDADALELCFDEFDVNSVYNFQHTSIAHRLRNSKVISVAPSLVITPLEAAIALRAKECKIAIAKEITN